jgi:hypothetical protein
MGVARLNPDYKNHQVLIELLVTGHCEVTSKAPPLPGSVTLEEFLQPGFLPLLQCQPKEEELALSQGNLNPRLELGFLEAHHMDFDS